MAGFKKALLYLGLGPDEEYEQFDEGYGADNPRPAPQQSAAPRTVQPVPQVPLESSVRAIRPVPIDGTADSAIGAVRPVPQAPAAVQALPVRVEGASVRAVPMSAAVKPHAISPTSFNDAQAIADRFMVKQPVIVNLQGIDRDLSRRLIDFASGLCYGVGGQMERVANQVYLLTPTNTEVSSEDRERLSQGQYPN
jgi:cell division inhibitor SepF